MDYYQEKLGNLHTTFIETKKFKSNRIVFKFRAPLTRETLTKRALLAMMFETNNAHYKTQTDFRRRLAYLYGANFFTSVEKKGNEHIITAVFDMVDAKLVPESEQLLADAFDFLNDVFFAPNVSEQAFDEETFAREKVNLKSRLESIYDDKIRYANVRLIEEMFAGDVFAYPASGIISDIEGITAQDLYSYYKEFLQNDIIELFICGDMKPSEVAPFVRKLGFSDREMRDLAATPNQEKKEERFVTENQAINQAKLVLGYQTGVYFGDTDFVPLQLANGLLGGYANSKIFINVREKASLAYYASSRLDTFKGFMIISAGIDEKNREEAIKIIKEQIKAMKVGDFTEEELAQTKEMYVNQLLETSDGAQGLIELAYNNVLKNSDLTLDNWIRKIKATTKEEVVAAIQKIQADTVYFLAKGE
ncbi:insulinase family protein [Listeria fleischmannii]|uniref:Insulinase family protein n=1 Tax=Listeria fleischmannii TaxID=1069827 RepID=A0A841YG16_9LIST|nr:pitrilysin family protein [Listeria fleischmannii]MBC1399196.1 insulinase family protein [Listeria fleischmannii]MBC1427652.1 insulinase family protein [Listeria fleischmannii]STY34847.1 Peptidase M16 inactive domain [Listeria fleischmannii subsp. coloradonensis]